MMILLGTIITPSSRPVLPNLTLYFHISVTISRTPLTTSHSFTQWAAVKMVSELCEASKINMHALVCRGGGSNPYFTDFVIDDDDDGDLIKMCYRLENLADQL